MEIEPAIWEEESAGGDVQYSTGRKILVKLKLTMKTEEKTKHLCKECNKGFGSGKALGGHMSSAHVQANSDRKTKRPFKSSTTAEITCRICRKSFRSQKSLFGHMRCHPERCYRGMVPPPPHLNTWPPGIKRPRGTLLRNPTPGPTHHSDIDERVQTAVEVLKHMKGQKHVCDFCNKGFSTYQALGGHRSSHTKLKLGIDENDYNNPTGKVVSGFDLNMMPEDDQEEDSSN